LDHTLPVRERLERARPAGGRSSGAASDACRTLNPVKRTVSRLDRSENDIVRIVLEGILLRHESRRVSGARPISLALHRVNRPESVLSFLMCCKHRYQRTPEVIMATVTVRNLPDEVHRALRVRAAMNGRSAEAEIREILEATVRPRERLRLGTALAELGRRVGLTNEDFEVLEHVRDKMPAEPVRFE
jgi:plasmid stability protein